MTSAQKAVASYPERPWTALPPELATALRPFLPRTVDEIIETIRRTVPAYARPLRGAFGVALRGGVERALGDFLDEVEGKDVPAGDNIYVALGRGEAREGRTMEALLAAYRLGARVAWRRSAERGRRAGFDADTLTLLAEAFFAYIDQLSALSAQGYAEEQSLLAGELARRRRMLLGLLVQSPPAEALAVESAAREVGWELPAELAAVVWRDESEQPVARRLPLGSLAAPLDELVLCALVPDPDAPGRRAEIEAALGRRRGAVGPTVPWSEAWLSAARARAVQRLIAEGLLEGNGLAIAEDHLAELIVHGDPGLIAELARRRLAPLESRPQASRERLRETLAAWLDEQGNVPRVAEALHVHPQTVRYRLGQLRELFGERLDDPAARFELGLALRAPR
ncbi:MAG: PucR family transcriptional regulator [Thermoleophilaceae bacterium]